MTEKIRSYLILALLCCSSNGTDFYYYQYSGLRAAHKQIRWISQLRTRLNCTTINWFSSLRLKKLQSSIGLTQHKKTQSKIAEQKSTVADNFRFPWTELKFYLASRFSHGRIYETPRCSMPDAKFNKSAHVCACLCACMHGSMHWLR